MDRGEFIMGQNWVEQYRRNIEEIGWECTIGVSTCELARRRGTDVFSWYRTREGDRWGLRHLAGSDPAPSLIK